MSQNWCAQSGGGSGGSIWVQTNHLTGTGTIQANGGYPWGGGGRIAIEHTTSSFTGQVQAFGTYGPPGTVYWKPDDKLVVDNNGDGTGAASFPDGSYSFSKIELKHHGNLTLPGDYTLTSNNIVGDGTSNFVKVGGVFNAPQDLTLNGFYMVMNNNLVGAKNLTLNNQAFLEYHPDAQNHTFKFDTISLQNGSALYLYPYNNGDQDYTNDKPVIVDVGNLSIDATSRISSDKTGYSSGTGPGVSNNGGEYGGFVDGWNGKPYGS